jgi:hypothetical protein
VTVACTCQQDGYSERTHFLDEMRVGWSGDNKCVNDENDLFTRQGR